MWNIYALLTRKDTKAGFYISQSDMNSLKFMMLLPRE